MRIITILFLSILISCNTKTDFVSESEILWDTWGIPHIYGKSEKDVFKMMGWAQMRNHGDLILRLYGESRGRASEYWGGDFRKDVLLHQLGVIEGGKLSYDNLPETDKGIIQSFTDGMNAYANKFPEALDEKYKVVLPITPEDVSIHSFRVLYLEFLINRNLRNAPKWPPGSNAWAINNDKIASGKSMLLANPHLVWRDFWLFFEAHMITSENNLYGATLVGLPTIGIGFNQFQGWAQTVNILDNVDFYELTLDEGKYEIDGTFRAFEKDTISITKRTGETVEVIPILRKKSAFGMIMREEGDKALAVRWPNADGKLNMLRQWKAMGDAQSTEAFKDALKINSLPLFNVVYADREGNILYHFGGNVPKKNGDWDKWQSIVPTTSSEDIWNDYYSADELPSFMNPESNWIQNANDGPFTSTFPPVLDPSDFPSHMTSNTMAFRPQRSATLIGEAKNLTLDELIKLKHDTKSQLALRLQDDFQMLSSMTEDSLTLEALKLLTEWDGSFNKDSRASVFFASLANNLNRSLGDQVFGDKWTFEKPLETPDNFENPEQVLQIIKATAEGMLAKSGRLAIPYGDVFRLKVGEHEYPANGGASALGIFRTMNPIPGDNGRFYCYHGDGYVCAIEFGEEIRAKALLSYGNATQPGNPHVGDQLKLFSEKKLRDVWLTRKQHEDNLELLEKMDDM